MSLKAYFEFADRHADSFIAATTRDRWQVECGGAFEAIEPLLVPNGKVVRTLPSARLGEPRLRLIHRDGVLCAISDKEPEFLREIPERSIVKLELDPRTLRQSLALALGLTTANTQIVPTECLLHIGDWKPRPSARAAVLLVRTRDRRAMGRAIRERLITYSQPSIFLLMSESGWDDSLAEEVKRCKSVMCLACDVVETEKVEWVAGPMWNGVKAELQHRTQATREPRLIVRKRPPKRATRRDKVVKLRHAIEEEAWRRIDEVRECNHTGKLLELEKPVKQELCNSAGIDPSEFSRVLNDTESANSKRLFGMLSDADALLKWSSGKQRSSARMPQ